MIYALIGFIGVVLGVICTCTCLLVEVETKQETVSVVQSQDETDLQLAKQWQNLLNYTADAGGEQDAER